MKKILLVITGSILFVVGIIGVIIPIFPTSPFLFIGTVFLMKGSKKFSNWFKKTKIYQKHLKTFVEERSITLNQKLFIIIGSILMITITLLFASHIIEKLVTSIFFTVIILYFASEVRTISSSKN